MGTYTWLQILFFCIDKVDLIICYKTRCNYALYNSTNSIICQGAIEQWRIQYGAFGANAPPPPPNLMEELAILLIKILNFMSGQEST